MRVSKLQNSLLLTFVGVLATIAAPSIARADFGFDSVKLSDVSDWFKRQVAKQTIQAKIKLLDIHLTDGITAGWEYKLKSEPSYLENNFTRYDIYRKHLELTPNEWFSNYNGPLGLQVMGESEISFARQSDSQTRSVFGKPYLTVDTPYTTDRTPLTAKKAKEELNAGDFVGMTTHLMGVGSIGKAIPAGGALTLSENNNAHLNGTFLVHFYKLSDHKVRLKLIGIQNGGTGVDFNLTADNGFEILGFKLLDRQIKRIVDLNLVNASTHKDVDDLYMVDYVLDLNDPRVAAAYDHLMDEKFHIKARELATLDAGRNIVRKVMASDFKELEDIYNDPKEQAKDPADRAVDRRFKGSALASSTGKHGKTGIRPLKWQYDSSFSEKQVTNIERDNSEQNYVFDTFSKSKERKSWWHIFDKSDVSRTNQLFTADKNFHPEKFVTMAISRELKSRTFSQGAFEDIRDTLKRTLPSDVYKQIKWKKWETQAGDAVNVYFKQEIYFPIDALIDVPIFKPEEIQARYKEFLKTIPEPSAYPISPPRDASDRTRRGPDIHPPRGLSRYDHDIEFISQQLAIAFDPKNDQEMRYDAFEAILDNSFYQETGAGFLISLLPKETLEKDFKYTMELSGKGADCVSYQFGFPEVSELYKSMLYIDNVLYDRSIDLRLLNDVQGPKPASN